MPATSTVVISRREFFGKKDEEEKKTENKAAENAEEQVKSALETLQLQYLAANNDRRSGRANKYS